MNRLQKIIILVVVLVTVTEAKAQVQVKPLSVGERCPFELLKLLGVNYKNNMLEKSLIIDFWATSCGPCLEQLPKLDTLQRKFNSELSIISLSREKKVLVDEILKRIFNGREPNITVVSNYDKRIYSYFPHQSIPHYVMIDKRGTIKAITGDLGLEAIESLINDRKIYTKLKIDTVRLDHGRPLYAGLQLPLDSSRLLFNSMLAKSNSGRGGFLSRGEDFIAGASCSLIKLYQVAFGKFDLSYLSLNRIELKGFSTFLDSVRIGYFGTARHSEMWKKIREENFYDYELKVPPTKYSFDQLFELMQNDLNRIFNGAGISGKMSTKKQKIRKLVKINSLSIMDFGKKSGSSIIYSTSSILKMQNQPIPLFISALDRLTEYKDLPLLNKTGYTGPITIEISTAENTISSINMELAKYGLKIEIVDEEIPIVEISKW